MGNRKDTPWPESAIPIAAIVASSSRPATNLAVHPATGLSPAERFQLCSGCCCPAPRQ